MKHFFIIDKYMKDTCSIVYDFYSDKDTAINFLKVFEKQYKRGLYLCEVFNV